MVIQILVQALSVLLSNRLYTFLNAGIIVCTFVETYALPLVFIKWILVATKYGNLVVNGCGNNEVKGNASAESQSSKVYYYKYSLELVTTQDKFVNRTREVNTISNRCRSQVSVLIVSGKNFSKCQLSYCGQDCSKIPHTLCKMYGAKVHCLDMSYNKIESLKGLELFASLEELILDNNQLGDGLTLPFMPLLKTLSLNNNHITDLELLLDKVSERLPQLTYLSLLGNQACPDRLSDLQQDDSDYQRYRYFVLHKLPGLRFLDWRRVSGAERAEARTRGVFMRVRRPPPPPPQPHAAGARADAGRPRPLPVDFGALGKHKGAYGKCNYTYTGKHSEGNRFIGNSDL